MDTEDERPCPKAILLPREVGTELHVNPNKVRDWIRRGELRASNVSDSMRPQWVVRREDLDQFLKGRQVEPMSQKRPKTRRQSDPDVTEFF